MTVSEKVGKYIGEFEVIFRDNEKKSIIITFENDKNISGDYNKELLNKIKTEYGQENIYSFLGWQKADSFIPTTKIN